MSGYLGMPGVSRWTLRVKRVEDVSAELRSVLVEGSELRSLDAQPGQDVMLIFPGGARPLHRRYSIRRFDPSRGELELWFVLHGDGPAVRWARGAVAGDTVEAAGPRGKITLVEAAAWHLFAGDATFVPAAFAMMEAATAPALGLFTAGDPPPAPHGVRWLAREALAVEVLAQALPPGRGHAYVAGELSLVNELRAALEAKGLEPEQVASKPYWRAGRANQAQGEPERS